jgi:hypothetical protein
MPCRDDQQFEDEALEQVRRDKQVALMCNAMRFIEGRGVLEEFFNLIHYRSGITPIEARVIWAEHKAQDEQRKQQEKKERDRHSLGVRLWQSMTKEQREAIEHFIQTAKDK